MPSPQRMYIDGEIGQLHVYVSHAENATKPPLYCAHQSPKNGSEFLAFMTRASQDRSVVAMDYPGYGMSDPAPSEEATSIELYARNYWRVADKLGHSHIDVFGNHTGAQVAAEMAIMRPENVGSIAMISAALLNEAEEAEFRKYFTPIPLDEAGTRFKTMWERIIGVRGPDQDLYMLAHSFRMNLMGGEAYEWGHTAAFNHCKRFHKILADLPHSITILNPNDDLGDITHRATPLMQRGEIIDLPQWGYGFMDAYTQQAVDLVLGKLDAGRK
ncbi:alpha/beta fold hydrolase [Hirschia litorea]|uniref:Alpha/beta fold hydrolase n=1 Tax=Hirschia litorea TaxID=1199156 RepID=A0ABW2IPE7_9PROT